MANINELPSTEQTGEAQNAEFATAKSGKILGESQSASNARRHLQRERRIPARFSGFMMTNTKQPQSPPAKPAKPGFAKARLGLVKIRNDQDGSCVKVESRLTNQRLPSSTREKMARTKQTERKGEARRMERATKPAAETPATKSSATAANETTNTKSIRYEADLPPDSDEIWRLYSLAIGPYSAIILNFNELTLIKKLIKIWNYCTI